MLTRTVVVVEEELGRERAVESGALLGGRWSGGEEVI